jgi:hypothetical protein
MKGFLPDDLEAFDLKSTFWRAYSFSSGRRSPVRNMVVGVIGFKQQPEDRVWDILKKNSALAVKAQYALWARAYAETDAEPSVYISLTISQFCDDLGFKRKKEMHKLRNKQAAIAALELLTSLELVCVFQPPRGRTQRIRGPIWTRGVISEELVGYQDLFSEGSAGNFSRWVPKAFSYAPGAFFANDAWRAYNKFIAFVGEGLLKLSSENSDKYAVMVGGYLAILARMNSYQQSKVKVRTLVEKTGLWAVDRQKNPGRMESKLEKALDRLREVGVIKDWLITSSEEEIDPDNLDDERTLEGLSRPARWTKGWLAQSVIVDWPDVLEKRGKMLRENRSKQINKALKRSKKSNPTQ